MSDTDTDSFWRAVARRPRQHPASKYLNAAYNPAPPEPEPPAIEAVATMDTVAYAANRDQLMNGIKPASEFRGVDMPTGRAALTAEQMTALGMGYGAHANTGYTPRDPSYRQAQHTAAAHTSVGAAPATTSSITRKDDSR